MEGRGLSDLYRNTSEEIFMRSYMENSIGVSVPTTTTTTMDVLGFKNLSQTFRTDSEELFKSWLTNGENNCYNSPSLVHRTARQASRRISSEITNFVAQQPPNRKGNENSFGHQSTAVVEDNDIPINANLPSVRNVIESSDLYLAKAWFNSPQPMTRSRSSELRRRYVAMQTAQAHSGYESLHHNASDDTNQDYANPNAFDIAFTSPIAEMDRVSSLVSMLKGTLEQKKLNGHIDKDAAQDPINQGFENPSSFQESDRVALQMIEESLDHDLEEFVNSANPVQSTRVSQEPSQSESSTAAPVLSSGFDACDGPSDSGHAISVSENESKKQFRNRNSNSKNGSRAKDIRERIIGSLKDERKRGSLHRHGSVTSSISGDKEDATKKRRVERSRKMAEAKERNLSPTIPSDMQSVLKRCETLEKEVRSLKLNLSFMNRKDSEQTKQIEELQKQNEELHEEKECLIEEINKFIQ